MKRTFFALIFCLMSSAALTSCIAVFTSPEVTLKSEITQETQNAQPTQQTETQTNNKQEPNQTATPTATPTPEPTYVEPIMNETWYDGKPCSKPLKIKFAVEEPAVAKAVPKRYFKRAVKRNLLKRRIRESYRRQKGLLNGTFDILFIYTSPEVLPYEVVFADMGALLSASPGAQPADNE